jgi:peptidoglycan/LPS O-acetylase OafA/YrhL
MDLVQGVENYEIVACLLYARNFFGKSLTLAHIWSLSLEEQFYLCWPGIFAFINEKRVLLVTTILTATIALWRGLAIHWDLFEYHLGIYYERPYFRFDSILIGALLVIGLTTNETFLRAAQRFTNAVPAAVLWVCLALWSYYGEILSRSNYLTIQMLFIAAILCQLALDGSPTSQVVFKNGVLCYFGKISYALYLWQEIFLVTKLPSWGILRQFPVNIAASVLLAMISYHVVETPALRLKRHFE